MDVIHMPALVKSDKVDICLSEIAVQAIISEYTYQIFKRYKKCKGAWIEHVSKRLNGTTRSLFERTCLFGKAGNFVTI